MMQIGYCDHFIGAWAIVKLKELTYGPLIGFMDFPLSLPCRWPN